MRQLKLWNYNKTEYVDLNDERFFATDLKGLGLEYDLAFNESTNGSYLDNLKVKDNDITAKIIFANYKAYDDFRAFVLRNGKQPFILEYTTEKITTTHRIELSQEDIDIDELDDEYFIRVKNVVQKYGLKRDTVKYTTNAMYPELTKDKYAEIVLLEGKTVEQDGELLSVKNPVIESVGRNLFDEEFARNHDNYGDLQNSYRHIKLQLKPNTVYYYNVISESGYDFKGSDIYYIIHNEFPANNYGWKILIHSDWSSPGSGTITTDSSGILYVGLLFSSQEKLDFIFDKVKIMLNEGYEPLPYEPYRSTELQFNGIYHKWDKIINDGGVYYDEIGSLKVNMWEYDDITTYDNNAFENVYRFIFNDFVSNLSINKNYDGYINKFELKEFYGDERGARFHPSLPDFEVFIEKSLIQEIMQRDKVLYSTAFKTYLQENNIQGVFQLATPTRKPTTYEGGIELFPNSNLFVTDDNNLLDTVELKYKPWNWSNVITKTNLRKYTVGGNDLVIYLPKSYVEHLDGETDEEKIQKYFADKYVEMLLANYIIDNEPIYRDVYISRLSKSELNMYGILESELVMRPQGAWYRLVELYQEHILEDDVIAKFEIKNNSIDLLPVNVRIEFINIGMVYDIYITSTDTIFKIDGHKIDPGILFIDSYNQKIYLNGLNAYDLLDKNGDSFILVPPGKHELWVELGGDVISVRVLVTYRQVV